MAMNSCLCSNGGNFITDTAKCLGTSDKSDVLAVYTMLDTSCDDSNTPLNVQKAAFFSAAGLSSVTSSASSTSTTSARRTSTTTGSATSSTTETAAGAASPTTTDTGTRGGDNNDDSSSPGGLSSMAKTGIIAGSVCVGVTLLGAAAFFFMRYRKKKDSEESHPMLPQKLAMLGGASNEAGPLPSTAEVTALGAPDEPPEWPIEPKWRPTPGAEFASSPSGFNWESPYDATPPAGWGRVPEVPEVPPVEALWTAPPLSKSTSKATSKSISTQSMAPSQVFELQGSVQPAEIAGTPVLPQGADLAYSGEGWGASGAEKK